MSAFQNSDDVLIRIRYSTQMIGGAASFCVDRGQSNPLSPWLITKKNRVDQVAASVGF
jgi:hypothetical protein